MEHEEDYITAVSRAGFDIVGFKPFRLTLTKKYLQDVLNRISEFEQAD